MSALALSTIKKLKNVSSPTIVSWLYKKGLKNKFIQDVKPLKLRKRTMTSEVIYFTIYSCL